MESVRKTRHEFRASWGIRWAVLAALVAWVAMGALGVVVGLPPYALFPVVFFVAFFLGFVSYYWNMAYIVDEYGVTYRGANDFVHLAWEDIHEVKDSELPLGGYVVTTRDDGLVLSIFVRGRQRLRDLIIARAGLFPKNRR